MENFKELSFEEMQEIEGGRFSLWSPSIMLVEFASGIMESYGDSLEYYSKKIKYQN